MTQSVYISKTVTIRGGYTTTNWTTSNPTANATTLDALGRGRVVYLMGGSGVNVTLENLTVRGGSINNNGGGIFSVNVYLTLSNAIVRDNATRGSYYNGGGVYINMGNAAVSGGQIFSNAASYGGYGGGVFVQSGSAILSGVQIFHNTAGGGGGVYVGSGSATLSGGQIASNTAGTGGGVFVAGGSTTLSGTQILNNAPGGGLCSSYGTLTVTNSTLSGNISDPGGGAIAQWGGSSSATLINSTIVSNTASITNVSKSGIWLLEGTLNIGNSIVAHNGVTNNVKVDSPATFTSLGYNLTNSGAGTPFTATGDLINTDPRLGPLQDNGGSTWTHALLPGSRAIDRIPLGVNGCGTTVTTDQRSQPRPGTFTHLCDIGAYEAQGVHYQIYLPLVIRQ
jgi:hypothetical protein